MVYLLWFDVLFFCNIIAFVPKGRRPGQIFAGILAIIVALHLYFIAYHS